MPTRNPYQLGKRFVARHARPLDYARWGFLFEGAPAAPVLDVLATYQNDDGGFGHAVEPDFWNPHSSPMQTWAATEIVQSLQLKNSGHPVVAGILKYLESGAHFDGHTWSRTIATNNDHPHAEWWTQKTPPPAEQGYNPTASLAGFALQFAAPGSRLHDLARQIAAEAFEVLVAAKTVEAHELSCFFRLYQSAVESPAGVGDLAAVEQALRAQANAAITRDTSAWATGYVVRPSRYIRSRHDRLFAENKELIRYECNFLRQAQLDDGSWPVSWHWSSYPDQWPVAREWWRSMIVIENLLFLRAMEEGT